MSQIKRPSYIFIALQAIGLAIAILIATFYPKAIDIKPLFISDSQCPVADYIKLSDHEKTQYLLHNNIFREKSAERFSRGIQIDTSITDFMTDFSKFDAFHTYLEETFPSVFNAAEVTKVNGYGLVLEFHGSNTSLKPIMLMAHQDTVPMGDPQDWIENPLGGRYDGEKVYGRGTNDVKNLLIGLVEAMELIIEDLKDGKLKRGVILAFGYDEESEGEHGAKEIGKWLFAKYGENSVDHIIDEGPTMFLDLMGSYYGLVVTGEKGYMDLAIDIKTSGGHSSNPREHTSIGMMSKFLYDYENDMFKPILSDENPFLITFECAAEFGNLPFISRIVSKLARANPIARYLLTKSIHNDPLFRYNVQTSQAIDIIDGGDKANSLPRNVGALINHRIAIGNDYDTIWEKATKHGKSTAEEFDIGLTVNNKIIYPETSNGKMVIYAKGVSVPVAPLTPLNDNKWFRLAGYMKSFYELEVYPEKFMDSSKQYIVTPATMTGNTDTKHYWKLTDHIYRVQPGITNLFEANMHGPNEWVHMDTHLQVIAFYYNYIRGVCGEKM